MRTLEWAATPSSGDLPDAGFELISPATPALQVDSLLLSYWESPGLHLVNLLWNRKKTKPQGAEQESFVLPSMVAQMIKNLPVVQETWVRFLGQEETLEKEMATHSCIPAWKVPWTEEPGGLQSMGLQRGGHDLMTTVLN